MQEAESLLESLLEQSLARLGVTSEFWGRAC